MNVRNLPNVTTKLAKKVVQTMLAVLLLAACTGTAFAEETPLASYEPSETGLTVTPGSGDSGLTLTIVEGGVGSVPAATDGQYVLKVAVVNESDKKVEFKHEWSDSTYNLLNEEQLLADVYVETSSAIPGLIGIWTSNWNPPDSWEQASGIPTSTGTWTTISFDVSDRSQTGLDNIWAFVIENLAGSTGTLYIDNLRFSHTDPDPIPRNIGATGHDGRIDVFWDHVMATNLTGYNIYRSENHDGPFYRQNLWQTDLTVYSDFFGINDRTCYYYVTSVINGVESDPSDIVSATSYAMTDEQLMSSIQEACFRYTWNFGHPVSGLVREGLQHHRDTCAIGGTGMGLMNIVVGSERGFVTRAQAAERVYKMLHFLYHNTTRYQGAFPHQVNGATGETIVFGPKDDGGDLVETSYLMQGIITVRQYFDDPTDQVETDIRSLANDLWRGVKWDWYLRYEDSEILWWHWSPNYNWDMNMSITGYNECMITYLMAIASPTHPIPATSYYNGWAREDSYEFGEELHGYWQWVGPAYGGPLFYTHYSFLGFDPRFKRDAFCNYWENNRNITLINRAHCIVNHNGFEGYSDLVWGLTSSFDPWGYLGHCPTVDNGTISPTAAMSAMPYTPEESIATMEHFYHVYGRAGLWGPFGFRDGFNLDVDPDWYSDTYIAIDQCPIAVMMENYRTQLCWRLFMSAPEIKHMVSTIGFEVEGDLDNDSDVDLDDYSILATCLSGPGVHNIPSGCSLMQFLDADTDNDSDVDLLDFVTWQQRYVP